MAATTTMAIITVTVIVTVMGIVIVMGMGIAMITVMIMDTTTITPPLRPPLQKTDGKRWNQEGLPNRVVPQKKK